MNFKERNFRDLEMISRAYPFHFKSIAPFPKCSKAKFQRFLAEPEVHFDALLGLVRLNQWTFDVDFIQRMLSMPIASMYRELMLIALMDDEHMMDLLYGPSVDQVNLTYKNPAFYPDVVEPFDFFDQPDETVPDPYCAKFSKLPPKTSMLNKILNYFTDKKGAMDNFVLSVPDHMKPLADYLVSSIDSTKRKLVQGGVAKSLVSKINVIAVINCCVDILYFSLREKSYKYKVVMVLKSFVMLMAHVSDFVVSREKLQELGNTATDIYLNFSETQEDLSSAKPSSQTISDDTNKTFSKIICSVVISLLVGGGLIASSPNSYMRGANSLFMLLRNLKSNVSSVEDLAKTVVESCTDFSFSGLKDEVENLMKTKKKMDELCFTPASVYVHNDALYQELQDTYNSFDDILKRLLLTKDAALKDLTIITRTLRDKLWDKLNEASIMRRHKGTRVVPICVVLSGKPGHGKTTLVNHLLSKLSTRLNYNLRRYDMKKQGTDAQKYYWSPVHGEEVLYCDDLFTYASEPLLDYLPSLISDACHPIDGASLEQKNMYPEFRLILATSNYARVDLSTYKVSNEQAYWPRMTFFTVDDPQFDPSRNRDIQLHRKPDFSHLKFTKLFYAKDTYNSNKAAIDISLDEIVEEIAFRMLHNEKQFVDLETEKTSLPGFMNEVKLEGNTDLVTVPAYASAKKFTSSPTTLPTVIPKTLDMCYQDVMSGGNSVPCDFVMESKTLPKRAVEKPLLYTPPQRNINRAATSGANRPRPRFEDIYPPPLRSRQITRDMCAPVIPRFRQDLGNWDEVLTSVDNALAEESKDQLGGEVRQNPYTVVLCGPPGGGKTKNLATSHTELVQHLGDIGIHDDVILDWENADQQAIFVRETNTGPTNINIWVTNSYIARKSRTFRLWKSSFYMSFISFLISIGVICDAYFLSWIFSHNWTAATCALFFCALGAYGMYKYFTRPITCSIDVSSLETPIEDPTSKMRVERRIHDWLYLENNMLFSKDGLEVSMCNRIGVQSKIYKRQAADVREVHISEIPSSADIECCFPDWAEMKKVISNPRSSSIPLSALKINFTGGTSEALLTLRRYILSINPESIHEALPQLANMGSMMRSSSGKCLSIRIQLGATVVYLENNTALKSEDTSIITETDDAFSIDYICFDQVRTATFPRDVLLSIARGSPPHNTFSDEQYDKWLELPGSACFLLKQEALKKSFISILYSRFLELAKNVLAYFSARVTEMWTNFTQNSLFVPVVIILGLGISAVTFYQIYKKMRDFDDDEDSDLEISFDQKGKAKKKKNKKKKTVNQEVGYSSAKMTANKTGSEVREDAQRATSHNEGCISDWNASVLDSVVEDRILSNTVRLYGLDKDGKLLYLHGIVVKSNLVCFPHHFSTTATSMFIVENNKRYPVTKGAYLKGYDLQIGTIGGFYPFKKDITNSFITEHNYDSGTRAARWWSPMKQKFFDVQSIYSTVEKTSADGSSSTCIVVQGIRQQPVVSVNGDCGGLAYFPGTSVIGKIIGMHIQASTNYQFIVPMSQSIIQKLLDATVSQVFTTIMDWDKEGTFYVPPGDFEFVGIVKDAYRAHNTAKHSFEKTPFFEEFVLPFKVPPPMHTREVVDKSYLESRGGFIDVASFSKYGNKLPEVDTKLLGEMEDELVNYLECILDDQVLKRLDNDQLFNGFGPSHVLHGCLGSLNLQSSPGAWYQSELKIQNKVPLVSTSPRGNFIPSKLGEDHMMRKLQEREELALQGVLFPSLVKVGLKTNELISKEKAAIGKVRTFMIWDVDFNLMVRKYCGYFFGFMHKYSHAWPFKIGYDPIKDFPDLYRDMASFSSNHLAADFKNWDGDLHADLIRSSFRVIRKIMVKHNQTKLSEESLTNVFDIIAEEHCSPFCLIGDAVVRTNHGMPSGSAATIYVNSIAQFLSMMFVWKKVTNDSIANFLMDVKCAMLGDDSWIAVNREEFNFPNISGAYKKYFNMAYVSSYKDGRNISSFQRLEEVTFCKRSFVQNGAFIHVPIDRESFQSHYFWTTENSIEHTKDMLDMILSEAYQHGPRLYHEELVRIQQIKKRYFPSLGWFFPTYKDMQAEYVKKVTDIGVAGPGMDAEVHFM